MVLIVSEWERFYKAVRKCQEKAAKDEIDPKKEEFEKDELIQLAKYNQRCFYKQLSYVGVRRFKKLIDELLDSLGELAEKASERQFKYQSKFIDPRGVLEFQEFSSNLLTGILEEIDEARYAEDIRLTDRMFQLSFYNNLAYSIVFSLLSPLLDLIDLANSLLGLNMDWVTSLVSVAMQESLVKQKLREIGQTPKKNDKFHKLLQSLISHYEESGERLDMDVLLAAGFRELRHFVVHDPVSWNPKENEANEIIRHTISLAKALYPESEIFTRAKIE